MDVFLVVVLVLHEVEGRLAREGFVHRLNGVLVGDGEALHLGVEPGVVVVVLAVDITFLSA